MGSVNKHTFSHLVSIRRAITPQLSLATCIYILAVMGGLGNAISAPNNTAGDPEKTLTVTKQYNLPIAEVSGLTIVRPIRNEKGETKEGSVNLYAIGDKSYEVVNFRTNGVSNLVINVHDAARVIGKDRKKASQWEAVTADGKDTICMLSETRSEISCLDRGLQQARLADRGLR